MRTFVMTLVVGLSVANLALAAGPCDPNACTEVQVCGSADTCGHCGCKCCCEKYCRVVCEMKKVKKHVWVVECEEFCITLPRRRCCCDGCGSCGGGSGCNCDGCNCGCGKCDPCEAENRKCYIPPRCGKMRVKKKLIKKEVVCLVPVYKCVVVYCCPKCECSACGEAASPSSSTKQASPPPAPAPNNATQTAPLPPLLSVR